MKQLCPTSASHRRRDSLLREKRGMTQETLASDAETTLSTLSVIERGLANPTWATVRDIATALGVSIGELAKLSEKHE